MSTATAPPTTAFEFWDGQWLTSQRELPVAFDVETEALDDPRQIPRLALATVSDGHRHFVIHPERLGPFLQQHQNHCFVGHNVQFDFWVVDQHLVTRDDPARRVLWDVCHAGRLRDTMILDMLIQLATGNYRAAGRRGRSDEQRVYPANLGDLAAEFTGVHVSKDDPYRLRFGELIGLSPERLAQADHAFFRYAVTDVVATHRLYPVFTQLAYELMVDCGYGRGRDSYEILPDAIERFGYLSEVIQVKASIVLADMFRRGVTVNMDGVRRLEITLRERVDELTQELQRDFVDVLTTDREGRVRLTPQSRTPSFGNTRLTAMLTRVAAELAQQDSHFQVPRSNGKRPGISRSAKQWDKHRSRHRFLGIWGEMKSLEKQLGFLQRLSVSRLHCSYSLLVRTGRTSCSKPRDDSIPGVNLQQMPKDPAFRGLFVSHQPNERLLIADYAAIELRTLAAVCLARYGRSALADVIRQGTDPHAFTAASIQGLELDAFMALKQTDPASFRRHRQAAKAINFGVPGGLGAKTLREYAQANYGVVMSEQEAAEFREKLISKVYPELNDRDGYLADPSMHALSRNLGLPESLLWDAFDQSGERKSIAARGVVNVIGGRSQASDTYQQRVWARLRRLCDSCTELPDDVREAIETGCGTEALRQRLYHQKVATLTGRVRAGVGYTDGKNTPFQSLAADGSKLALWNLLYTGSDVYGFVHDEILINLPESSTDSDVQRVVEIMESSMEEVLYGIPANCEWAVSDRWTKPD